MKFKYCFNETVLCLAVRNGNVDIVKHLLMNNKIDPNIFNI